jgi:peptidoglycan hydrolase-like protein with peptidoglycan-binding domain
MLLKRGDNNEDVKKLQIKLGLEPIGNFGPKTEEAVKAFQTKNGLTADGKVGPNTWAKIMGET